MTNVARLALGVTLLVGLPVVASAADSMKGMAMPGKLNVAAAFSPAPPKKGLETITVTVKDASGKPVKRATVKIASNMPTMSMSGPTLMARETGNGTYSAKANLNFATLWTFDISVATGGQTGKARLTADIK